MLQTRQTIRKDEKNYVTKYCEENCFATKLETSVAAICLQYAGVYYNLFGVTVPHFYHKKMTGVVPNGTEEFAQLQLLCTIYAQNNPVMLQQVRKFYTQQSVNVHLILPTHVLQHIVSIQDLQNNKYKDKQYVLTIRENYIEAPPQTTSQEYVLFTIANTGDIVYPFNFYDRERHEFTVQLCDLVPVYYFMLYAPDFNDPQYQQYGLKNVLYQFRDNNVLNIQQNNRHMQQLSYQILNLDQMITDNSRVCEEIEQKLYENFKAQVKYVQDVNMFNINRINTVKQQLVSQLNKFNRLVNATIGCLSSLKAQESLAQQTIGDLPTQQSIYSTNYTYSQLNNIDLIVSNLTSISQQHQAQQLANIKSMHSENLLNQFLNMPISNVILETVNNDNSEVFNSPFTISTSSVHQQIDSKRVKIEQLQKVSFQFENQKHENMFNVQSINYSLQRDFQQFLQQLLNQHSSSEVMNTIRRNQQIHDSEIFLSNNPHRQHMHGFSSGIENHIDGRYQQSANQNEINKAIHTIEDYQGNQIDQATYVGQHPPDPNKTQAQQESHLQQEYIQQKPQIPQVSNEEILSNMLKIELPSNGEIEKKAKTIAKACQLNSLDIGAIYKQLFGLECQNDNLKGLWTVVFYHYGKYSQGSIVQMKFKKIPNYSQQQPILILSYTSTQHIHPVLIVQNKGCYYDLYNDKFTEFSDISRTLEAVSGQNINITFKQITMKDQQVPVVKQIIYELI